MDGLPMLPGSQNATLAQLMAEIRRAQEDAYAAGDMAQAGYIPNSGLGGALLMGLQGFVGNKKRTEAEKRLSDRAREYFDAQNRQQQEAMRLAAEKEERDYQRLLERDRKREEAKAANRAPARPQFSNGLIFDPNTGEVTKTPFFREPAGPAPERVTYGAPVEMLDPTTGRPVFVRPGSDGSIKPVEGFVPKPDKAADPAAPKPLSAEAATKLALLENARREAVAYLQAVSPDGKEFSDISAALPENARRRESAIRAKLRAESGATITPDEIEGEEGRYGPKLFSTDQTNVDAGLRMVQDIDNQIAALTGEAPEPFTFAGTAQEAAPSAEPRAVNPKTGEVLVLRNGKWVKE